jgi:hypothetical protein
VLSGTPFACMPHCCCLRCQISLAFVPLVWLGTDCRSSVRPVTTGPRGLRRASERAFREENYRRRISRQELLPLCINLFGQCISFGTAAGGMRNKGAQKPPLTMYPGEHCALFTAGMGAAAAGISAMSIVAKAATDFIIRASSRCRLMSSGGPQRKAPGRLGATPGPSVPVRACEGSKKGRRPRYYQLRRATKSPARRLVHDKGSGEIAAQDGVSLGCSFRAT